MDSLKDKISIIVPVYNAEKTIGECLNSIIQQTYRNIEILLINDGSNDKSAEIIKSVQKEEHRIKLVEVENGGVSRARNLGIEQATGKYIAFIDADDIMFPNMIERLYDSLTEHSADIVACKYCTDLNSQNNDSTKKRVAELDKSKFLKEIMLPQKDIAAFVWNRLYNAELIRKNGIKFDERVLACEDTLFNYEYLKVANKLLFLDETLYFYRVNNDSAMFRRNFNPAKLTANIAFGQMLADIQGKTGEEYVQVACMLYNLIMMFQVYKYSYVLLIEEKNEICKNLKLNVVKYNKASISIKYKIGRWVVLYLPYLIKIIV